MKTLGAVLGTVAAGITLGIAALFAVAGLAMILVGMWHGVRPAVPPIGFGEAVIVTALAGVLTGSSVAAKR